MPDCKVWSARGQFLARFLSAQNSLKDQFLRRFSKQFAALPAQFSKKGLQILLLPRTEQFQCNPSSSDLGWLDEAKARIMRETGEARGS